MTINTKAKRASVQAYTAGLMRPPPDGAISAADRAVAAWFYSGRNYLGPASITTQSGWFSFHNAFHEAAFIALMMAEADDAAVWSFWAAGIDLPSEPIPKLTGNLELNFDYFISEANGSAFWCRWANGTQPGNRGNAEIDLQAGEEVRFT